MSKLEESCLKELRRLEKQELALAKRADRDEPDWKRSLSEKVPEKVTAGLKAALGKAFSVIFEKGTPVIDKTYNKTELMQSHQVQDYAVRLKGSRRELRRMRKTAGKSNLLNSAVTTVEGVGLGALGIGMPDIVLFIGFLLKGAYETAAQYGFDYNQPEERLLILRMMEASLSKKEGWAAANARVDELLASDFTPSGEELREQIRRTSDVFAVDMLVLKFVQGLPIVGIIGGVGNPVYYNKILKYIQIKYYKRYLMGLLRSGGGA